ncbi:MAG: hypothetical protein ABI222_06185 [Opitutaceae bacterium]
MKTPSDSSAFVPLGRLPWLKLDLPKTWARRAEIAEANFLL